MKRCLLPGLLLALFLPGHSASAQTVKPDPALEIYASTDHSVTLADGRHIHIVCEGQGWPTIILTAGLADWSVVWNQVQPELARHTRTCAWDRAGFGLSDPSAMPQTIDTTTIDLEQALVRGGIDGPYVMVGHSLGGYESMLFADRHPAEIKGMILVDPSIPDQPTRFAAAAPALYAFGDRAGLQWSRSRRRCGAELRRGSLKPGAPDPDNCLMYPPELPPSLVAALQRLDTDPARFETQASLMEGFTRDGSLIVDPKRDYGQMPLIILTATDLPPFAPDTPEAVRADAPAMLAELARGHENIAALSARGVDRGVAGTNHYIQLMKPETVVAAILAVVGEVRGGALQVGEPATAPPADHAATQTPAQTHCDPSQGDIIVCGARTDEQYRLRPLPPLATKPNFLMQPHAINLIPGLRIGFLGGGFGLMFEF